MKRTSLLVGVVAAFLVAGVAVAGSLGGGLWTANQNPDTVEPAGSAAPSTGEAAKPATWWQGQLHIHANWSDPTEALAWYRYHGYQFAAITQLNHYQPVDGLKPVFDDPGRFLVIPGYEYSVEPGTKIIDVMGYGGDPSKLKAPPALEIPAAPAAAVLDEYGQQMRKAGVTPYIAHPNLNWSITAEDMLKTDPKIFKHFEIRNGEPGMNDLGGGGVPSTEQMWDDVLSTGRAMYAIADDDSHHFDDFGRVTFFNDGGNMFTRYPANPGRCSVFVRAAQLETKAILKALDEGDFYSACHFTSAPLRLVSYAADSKGISIGLPSVSADLGWSKPSENDLKYRTYFIGKDGKVLKVDESLTPSYTFQGDEFYVRVRIEDSDGGVAWTQPVFLKN